MALARHWKITCVEGNGAAYVGFHVEFIKEGWAWPHPWPVAASASSEDGVYTATLGGINGPGFWRSAATGAAGQWIQFDLGTAQEVTILDIQPPGDTSYPDLPGCPRVFDVETSPDGVTWTHLARCHTRQWVERTFHIGSKWAFRVDPPADQPGGHRLWGINITGTVNGAYAGFQHVELRGARDGFIRNLGRLGYASASSQGATTPALNAAEVYASDGHLTWPDPGYWVDLGYWKSASGTLPEWWRYDLGYAATVRSVKITPRADDLTVAPRDFSIQFSDDGGATWTTAKSFTGVTWPDATPQTFDLVPTKVLIGGVEATDVVVVDEYTIEATTSAHPSEGPVDVTILWAGSTADATIASAYYYGDQPTFDAPAASLALSGAAPSLAHLLASSAAQLALQGVTPTAQVFDQVFSLLSPAANLALCGASPSSTTQASTRWMLLGGRFRLADGREVPVRVFQ